MIPHGSIHYSPSEGHLLTLAASFNFGWEVMVALIALFAMLGVLGIVAMLRIPRDHHLRIGFFLEREAEDQPERIAPDEDTAEWPGHKE